MNIFSRILSRVAVGALFTAALGATASAQLLKLSWAGAISSIPGTQCYGITPIPGGGYLVATGYPNNLAVSRINEDESVAYTIYPYQRLCDRGSQIKILSDGNFYIACGGGGMFTGKFNLATGATVGSNLLDNANLYDNVCELGPDLSAYFVQSGAAPWTAAPAGSPDVQEQDLTLAFARVSNTLGVTKFPITIPVYGHSNTRTYYTNPDFFKVLLYKNQTYGVIGGRYFNGPGSVAAPFLAAWALDSTGNLLWSKNVVLDTSSVGGTHSYFPYSLGFDLSGNLTGVFQVGDNGTHGALVGATFDAATGTQIDYSGADGLADKEYATGGFFYREYRDNPRQIHQLTDIDNYFWNSVPSTTMTKRNATDTSTIWNVSGGQAICRIPFQVANLLYNNGDTTYQIDAMRDVDLVGATTTLTPASKNTMTQIAQQQDTGNVLVAGSGLNNTLFFSHMISQPVLNSYTYAVPKNHAFTSPNSIFFADRFVGGLSPQIGAYVKHGTLILHTDGTFVYTPTTGFTGTDFFIYRVQRPGLPTVSAEIGLSVS